MSFDGVVTMAIARELRSELLQGKIEKIYQPQPEQILLSIHTNRGRRLLFLSVSGNHSAVYLVDKMTENPLTPPTFCMVLRKHIGGARIVDIQQQETDRILDISMETIDEMGFNVNRKLSIEIMGKHSNILLIDMGKNRIIDSIKHITPDMNRVRTILPGKEYTPPPKQDKVPFTEVSSEAMEKMISSEQQPERDLLSHIQGISPSVAQTLASAGFGGDQQDGTAFSPALAFTELRKIIDAVEEGSAKAVLYLDSKGNPADFHIIPLTSYEQDPSYHMRCFDSISEAAACYFVNRDVSNTLKQKSGDLGRLLQTHLDKLQRKLQRLQEDRKKAEDSEKYRLYGELLTANLHQVPPGAQSVTVTSYYDGQDVKIPLDPRFSPARNAQLYYKKYGKAKTAVREKALQIGETQEEIEYLQSVESFVEGACSLEELDLIRQELVDSGYIRFRKSKKQGSTKKNRPDPHTYTLSSGRKVLAGRNNRENDWLTTKRAAGKDLWFHTKDIPGSHVILLLEGEEACEEDLLQTAQIAAWHSKGKASANVPVDYTQVRYVKKPSGAKPGMVIFTHNRTLYVEPKLPDPLSGSKQILT